MSKYHKDIMQFSLKCHNQGYRKVAPSTLSHSVLGTEGIAEVAQCKQA